MDDEVAVAYDAQACGRCKGGVLPPGEAATPRSKGFWVSLVFCGVLAIVGIGGVIGILSEDVTAVHAQHAVDDHRLCSHDGAHECLVEVAGRLEGPLPQNNLSTSWSLHVVGRDALEFDTVGAGTRRLRAVHGTVNAMLFDDDVVQVTSGGETVQTLSLGAPAVVWGSCVGAIPALLAAVGIWGVVGTWRGTHVRVPKTAGAVGVVVWLTGPLMALVAMDHDESWQRALGLALLITVALAALAAVAFRRWGGQAEATTR